jgi:cell division protein ZapA
MSDVLVPVEILGQTYPIRSRLDAAYVEALADYVDAKMKAAADATPSADSLRVAVLAALNIADEFFRTRDGQSLDDAASAERLRRIERLIDNALGPDLRTDLA